MKNFYFLFSAYSVTWVAFFWYLYTLWRKQERIEQGIQRINEQFQKK